MDGCGLKCVYFCKRGSFGTSTLIDSMIGLGSSGREGFEVQNAIVGRLLLDFGRTKCSGVQLTWGELGVEQLVEERMSLTDWISSGNSYLGGKDLAGQLIIQAKWTLSKMSGVNVVGERVHCGSS